MADTSLLALQEELARLRAHVDGLEGRLASLEEGPAAPAFSHRYGPIAPPHSRAAAPGSPAQAGSAARGPIPAGPPWWQVGPLRNLSREQLPTFFLATLGGVALLLGLLFFVWYSVEQGWLSPALRVISGAAIGLLLLAASWVLAGRDQQAVAAGVGGAGLGAWFAAWMVARHVHEFVGSREALVALALGCAAALLIAGTRRLRAMAWIAAGGALLTPIVTSDGSGSLSELMLYQSVVIVTLAALDLTRRWPELMHLATVGTWVLMIAWIAENRGEVDAPIALAWCAAALLCFHGQAVAAWRAGRLRSGHALARLAVGGGLGWFVLAMVASAADEPEKVAAWGTLATAILHAGLLLAVRHHSARVAGGRALMFPLAAWCWLQLFAFAPLSWGEVADREPTMAIWWAAMAVAATVADLQRSRPLALLAGALPFFALLGWSFGPAEPAAWRHALGFGVAGLPLALALIPRERDAEGESESARGELARGWLLLGAGVTWAVVAWIHTDLVTWGRPASAIGLAALVAATVSAGRRATPTRVGMTLVLALGLLILCFGSAVTDDLFVPQYGAELQAPARAVQIASLFGLLALCRTWELGLARLRARSDNETWMVTAGDSAGLLAAFAAGLAAMIAVGWAVAYLVLAAKIELVSATSLAQAGFSSVWAACALWLLLRGLRRDRDLWRIVALTWLSLAGLKIVFVDLSHVDLAWRVLSFVSLGACLLVGAYAYRRFVRVAASAEAIAPDTAPSRAA